MTTATPAPQQTDFLDHAFALVDAMEIEPYVALYTEDCRFTFGNNPAAVGRDAVRAGLEQFYASITGMRHDIVAKWWAEPTVGVVEARVTYTRHDTSTVTLPVVTIYRMRDGAAHDVRIFIDLAPLFAGDTA